MKGIAIALSIPAIVFASLFGIERVNHQASQAELVNAQQKLSASSALQGAVQAEIKNLETQLNTLRTSHNQYVTDTRSQIEDLEAARDKAKMVAKTAQKAAAKRNLTVADADLEADQKDPQTAFAQNFGKTLSKMFDAPAMQARMKERQLKRLDRTHVALFKKLGLNEADTETLKNLLVDRRMGGMGNGLSLLNLAGDQGGIQTAVADRQTKQEETDAELRKFLGDDAFATYQNYEKTLPQRQTVDRVAKALSKTDAPLSDDQSDRLIELMHETQTAARAESMKDIVKKSDDGNTVSISLDSSDFQERSKTQNDLVLKQAQDEGLLNDDQQAALEKQLNRQANHPFGAMMSGGGFSFGGDGAAGAINIQMSSETTEVQ